MSFNHSVEIDCGPGINRPNVYFQDMCEKCAVDINWFFPPTKSFGNWEWVVKSEYEDKYKEQIKNIKKYLKNKYKEGSIRYGSW